MYLLVVVKGLQPLQDLLHDVGADLLGDLLQVLVDDVGECSPVHELDEHEEAVHVVVRRVVVYDVLIRAHGHHCGLYLYLVQDLLLRHLHHSHCPLLLRVLTVEGMVDCAHRALAELLGEAIELVGVVGEEVYAFDLLVEFVVGEEGVVGYLLLGFEASHDLDHDLGVVLDHLLADVVFGEELHHVGSEALDAAGAVEVHLQVHLVLEVLRPA